jgi:hypothetical protein
VTAAKQDWDAIRPEIERRVRARETLASIAADLGVSAPTMTRRLQAWGVERPRRSPRDTIVRDRGLHVGNGKLALALLTEDEFETVMRVAESHDCTVLEALVKLWVGDAQ